jgi:hypothetical protein
MRRRDYRALNSMRVKWYDDHAQRWYQFTPHFWAE